ncbi:hypothetical protein B296_00014816 [Ensete ventricosum]|uniref:Uncharacterized protein n=1 Tax=Ensete ventricosum TaxID=4639 RepID=A0A426XLQ6_ENSVE|nr:hypothetical protein B296_00014816 [Ensete ventricosum]
MDRGQSLKFPKLLRVLWESCTREQSLEFFEFIGAGSSFYPKDAPTPLSPSTPPPSLLPLHRRLLPLPAGSRPTKGRPPLSLATAPCGRPTTDTLYGHHAASGCARGQSSLLRFGRNLPCSLAATTPAGITSTHRLAPCKRRWPPFRAGPSRSQSPPCRAPWLRPGRGWLALHGGWPWLAAPPPRCLRCENIARTRRTILCDSISSHAV